MSENNHSGHYDLSLSLLETIFTALRENLEKRDTLTIGDLEESFEKIRNYWPNLLPIYEATCRECPAMTASRAFVPDSRRRDFVTRLVFSRLVNRIQEHPLPNNLSYPKILAPGIQANIQTLISGKEYTIYNDLARSIFVEAGTDKDDEIWLKIEKSESLTVSSDRIFIRLLSTFRNFNTRHWEFLRIIQASVDANLCRIDDGAFCEIFEALFGVYEALVSREDNRLRLDLYYGESTAEQIRIVLNTYQRYRQSVTASTSSRRPSTATGGRR